MALSHLSALMLCVSSVVALPVQTPPVPKAFPRPLETTPPKTEPETPKSTSAAPATTLATAPTATVQQPAGAPTAESLGAPLYPTAEFLESFDAGRGQRYYIFGTNAAYLEVSGYYKNVMRNGGRTIFEAPAMQQWDLAKFQDQTMSYQPSVVVKDYTWNGGTGYLFVEGTKEKRFKTVIQIVPAPAVVIK